MRGGRWCDVVMYALHGVRKYGAAYKQLYQMMEYCPRKSDVLSPRQ